MGELEVRLSSLKSEGLLFADKSPLFDDASEVEQLNTPSAGVNNEPCWEDYLVEDTLGEGSYGKIYKVRERNGQKRLLVIK